MTALGRFSRWLPATAAGAVALWVLAGDLQALRSLAREDAPASMPAAAPSATPASEAPVYEHLRSQALFGRIAMPAETVEKAAIDRSVADENLPEADLGLELFGVVAAGDERQARAIVATQGGQQLEYAIGEELTSGARLIAVRPTRVIIEYQQARQILPLREPAAIGGGIVSDRPGRMPPIAPSSPPPPPAIVEPEPVANPDDVATSGPT